jgi:hypothetical protein
MNWEAREDENWRGDIHVPDESWRGSIHGVDESLPEGAVGSGCRAAYLDPALPPMVTIYRAPDTLTADLIRGLLSDHQIPHVRLADAATGIFGVPLHLEIVVPESCAEEALAVIRRFVDADAGAPPGRGFHSRVRWLLPLVFLPGALFFAFLLIWLAS